MDSELRRLENRALKIQKIVERNPIFYQTEDDNELNRIRQLIDEILYIIRWDIPAAIDLRKDK